MPEVKRIESINQYVSLLDKATKLCIPVSINGVFQDIKRGSDASIDNGSDKNSTEIN